MGNRFEGKVAVVTGGASGIGRRTAEALLEQGARVVIGDRNEALLTECARTFDPSLCATAKVDVTAEGDVQGLVEAAVLRFGRLDIGVNSAGIGALSAIQDQSLDSWREVIDVCLIGVFLSVKHEIRQMVVQGEGLLQCKGRRGDAHEGCCPRGCPRRHTRQRRRTWLRRDSLDRAGTPGGPGPLHRRDPDRTTRQPRRHCSCCSLFGGRRSVLGERGDARGRRR
jgi:NAD(P)-dependent dehydrogenase (short-subunit alcohol dehydrogenase family)